MRMSRPPSGSCVPVVDVGLAQFRAHRQHHVRVEYHFLNGGVGQRGAEIRGMAFGEHPLARGGGHQRAIQRLGEAAQRLAGAARAAARDDERTRGAREHAHRRVDLRGRRPAAAAVRRQTAGPRASSSAPERRGGFPDTRGAGARCAARPGTAADDRARPRRCRALRATPNTPAASAAWSRNSCSTPHCLASEARTGALATTRQRHRIGIGLRGRGQDVGEPGPRDDEGGGRTAAQAGVAVRGETGALFVAHQHVAKVRRGRGRDTVPGCARREYRTRCRYRSWPSSSTR